MDGSVRSLATPVGRIEGMTAELLIVFAVRAAFVMLVLLGLTHLVRRHWAIQAERRVRVHSRPPAGSAYPRR